MATARAVGYTSINGNNRAILTCFLYALAHLVFVLPGIVTSYAFWSQVAGCCHWRTGIPSQDPTLCTDGPLLSLHFRVERPGRVTSQYIDLIVTL